MGCVEPKGKNLIEAKSVPNQTKKEPTKDEKLETKKTKSTEETKKDKTEKSFGIEVNPTLKSKLVNQTGVFIRGTVGVGDAGKLEDHYKVLNKLGQGTFGSVYRVIHIKSDLIRAMKMIKKSTINLQDDDKKFLKEIQILIQIDHPSIIKIFEYFQDETYFYVITEFVSGGELYDTISKWKSFTENKAAYIMRQLLSAVSYLHSNNIVHRDLKPENMMVEKSNSKEKNSEQVNIKLIDFGTCNYYDGKTKLTLKVGTPYYIAPEVLRRSYTEKCDIWSCGVIMYILLCGYPPFSGDTTEEIIEAVMQGKYTMEGPEWKKISQNAKDLVYKLLEFKVEKRISAEEAVNHKWIQEKNKKEEINEEILSNVLQNIKNFNAKEKLQQATLAFIVHFHFASQENRELKKIFQKLDINGDGKLTYKELKDGFCKLSPDDRISGVTENDLNRIIIDVDTDGNGYIEYEEFLRVTVNKRHIISDKNLRLAFDKFDENKDGKLSIDEIKNVLGGADNEYIKEIIMKIDDNGNGEIDYGEFKSMMLQILEQHEQEDEKNNNPNESKKKLGFLNPTKTVLDFTGLDKAIEEKIKKEEKIKEDVEKDDKDNSNLTSTKANEINEKILIDFEKDDIRSIK